MQQKTQLKRIILGTISIALCAVSAVPALAVDRPAGSFAPSNIADINTYGGSMNKYVTFDSDIANVSDLAAKGINFVLGLLGIIAVILILISGWQWMVAESEDKVKEARKRLVNSVIGLAIVALAWIIGFVIVNTLTTVIK